MIETGVGFPSPLFFMGVVENNIDERLEGRIQVRAFGIHGTVDQIPTADLPWATLIIGSHDVNFVVPPLNAWVFGLFLDGRSAQQPFILGLIPTQFTQINNPSISGWGVALGNTTDVNAQGSRAQDFGQPTLSRLARGENLEETYLLPLESTRVLGVPIAGGRAKLASVDNMGITGSDVPTESNLMQGPPQAGDIVEIVETGPGYNVVKLADGSVIRQDGARNWRNNNPGNLEFGPFAQRYGAIGTDGRFAIFPTYESGRSAKEALLFSSTSYSGMTIEQAINRYAPPNENNTGSYVSTVASSIGVPSTTQLSSLNSAQRNTMLDAMERVEGFRPGTVKPYDPNIQTASAQVPEDTASTGGGSSYAAPTQGQDTWNEPSVAYNAEYPYNRVIETAAGHVIELDDTPGSERIMLYHKNGSYIQMSPTTTTYKSPHDTYNVNEKNYHMYIGGTNVLTIDGDCHVLIKGNKIEEIMGNYQQIIHGNHEVGVAGQMNMNGGEQGQIRAASLIFESNVENLNIKTGKTIKFESGESFHIKSKDVFFEASAGMNIKSENTFLQSTADTYIKSENSFFEASADLNAKADNVKIGGGTKTSVSSTTVSIDSTIKLSEGDSDAPAGSTEATAAESAIPVQRPEPPAKAALVRSNIV